MRRELAERVQQAHDLSKRYAAGQIRSTGRLFITNIIVISRMRYVCVCENCPAAWCGMDIQG